MHKRFDHQSFEKKWQEKWAKDGLYDAGERDNSKEKEYVLVEWPYPSGNLHIGHWYAFAVPDIYVRYKRMMGKQVLFPMGFDAFGLPAENAAIKRNINPREWTESNIEYMKSQLASMGASFSWDKTTSSIDPDYYKWTQWMFTKFFEEGIAYRGEGVVNWCTGCNTVIANEQVLGDDTCERCGNNIEKKKMPQWMLRITDFADALIDDLETLDWPEHIKESQRNWIGRSSGAEIEFALSGIEGQEDGTHKVKVFTTRPDTLFGATFLAISPELAQDWLKVGWKATAEIEDFVASELKERGKKTFKEDTDKRGIDTGIKAVNLANGKEIHVWVVNYVLGDVGTGAIMAVPAHDERDFEFASKFGLPITQVVRKVFGEPLPDAKNRIAAGAVVYDPAKDKYLVQYSHEFEKYSLIYGGLEGDEDFKDAAIRETLEETGYTAKFVRYISGEEEANFYHAGKKENRHLIGRQVLLELTSKEQSDVSEEELAKAKPVWLTKAELIEKVTQQDDAEAIRNLFNPSVHTGTGNLCNSGKFDGMNTEEAKSAITEKVGGKMTNTYRLRDWSVGRQRYWGTPIPIVYDPEGKAHPIPEEHLPWILPEDVDFKPTGEAPLAKSAELKKRTEEIFGAGWTPEVETMDTFVDSSWYYLRYIDNKNNEELASSTCQQEWLPVDLYFGGAEHTTMHLLYSRFWQKALKKLGLTEHDEPYKRRINRGLIDGPDGQKMSKSKGNVVDPDDQVKLVGSDTVKMYLAFMGPYQGTNYPWDLGGVAGLHRFLERVNGLTEHIAESEPAESLSQLHKTIKKVSEDIAEFKFNTAISAMMIYVNQVEKTGLSATSYSSFLKLLAPFAPHLTEELWVEAGNSTSVHTEDFPAYDPELAKDDTVTIGVQVNGKLRGELTLKPDASEKEAWIALAGNAEIENKLAGLKILKKIYVQGRIINIITET